MTPALISLIAWSPFLLLALIFGLVFSFKGYKRGAARAGISIGVTIIACLISILVAKLIATSLSGAVSPVLENVLKGTELKFGADKIASLATSLASAVAALILYVPVFIILVSILKPVISFVFKKIIPKPKHVANKLGGLSIAIVDALLLALLLTFPLYGTLALADGVIDSVNLKDTKEMKLISAATDPFIVDVASIPPFSTAYDALMSCKVGGETVSISGTVREAAVILRHAEAINGLKKGEFNRKDLLALINGADKLVSDNGFAIDLVSEFLNQKLPTVKIPGIGEIELNEFYPALSDSEQLKSDLPAFFDLTEAMVKSGMVEVLVNKNTDMSGVDAELISKAFGNTLNHSPALSTFKSNLLNTVVDIFSKEIIDKGKDESGAVKLLCDAISAIPSEPLTGEDARKEGESFYLLMTGIMASSNDKTEKMGLGMMIEGLARHPMIGTEKVIDAAGAIMETSGISISDALLDKMEENLLLSVGKPIGENSFGKYCNTAFIAIEAFGGIADNDDSEEAKKESNESLKDLIVSDKDSLEAVKDTVSSGIVDDIGVDKEHADAFKEVIDATLDSIIDTECTDEEAEKEAEALGNILDAVTDVTANPEDTDKIVEEYATEIINECLDSKILSGMITKLTNKGKPDPLGIFTELTPDAKETVGETLDGYIENATTEEEKKLLEAFKLFVGIVNE